MVREHKFQTGQKMVAIVGPAPAKGVATRLTWKGEEPAYVLTPFGSVWGFGVTVAESELVEVDGQPVDLSTEGRPEPVFNARPFADSQAAWLIDQADLYKWMVDEMRRDGVEPVTTQSRLDDVLAELSLRQANLGRALSLFDGMAGA